MTPAAQRAKLELVVHFARRRTSRPWPAPVARKPDETTNRPGGAGGLTASAAGIPTAPLPAGRAREHDVDHSSGAAPPAPAPDVAPDGAEDREHHERTRVDYEQRAAPGGPQPFGLVPDGGEVVGQLLPSLSSTATPDSRSARRGLDLGPVGKGGPCRIRRRRCPRAAGTSPGRPASAAAHRVAVDGARAAGGGGPLRVAIWYATRASPPAGRGRLSGWGARGGPVHPIPGEAGVSGAQRGPVERGGLSAVGASAVRERVSPGCARGARAPPLYRDVPARRSEWRRRRGRRRVAGTYPRSL